jgi:hypothetical protein
VSVGSRLIAGAWLDVSANPTQITEDKFRKSAGIQKLRYGYRDYIRCWSTDSEGKCTRNHVRNRKTTLYLIAGSICHMFLYLGSQLDCRRYRGSW